MKNDWLEIPPAAPPQQPEKPRPPDWTIPVLVAGLFFLLAVAFYDVVSVIIWWVGVAIVAVVGTAVVGTMGWVVLKLLERLTVIRMAHEDAMIKHKDSRILVNGEQTYWFDWRRQTVEALHLIANQSHNGVLAEPTEWEKRAWLVFQMKSKPQLAEQLAEPSPSIQVAVPELLPALLRFDRAMLIGGSGSGKTSLLQHYVASKNGHITVLDPDDDRATWPANALVVGGGENYPAIEAELESFVAEKRLRYQQRAEGVDGFPAVYLVMDEWYKIIQNIDGGRYLKEMLVSLRKVQMGVLVISQSDRANALGLSGNFDLMSSFEAVVRLSGTAESGITATIDTGRGPVVATHPGPYRMLPAGSAPADRPYELRQPTIIEPAGDDEQVLALFERGLKPWKIGEIIFGSKGGWQTGQVQEILQKHGKL